MPEVTPFAAIRYDFSRFNNDVSKLIAPPYDVLSKQDKLALLAQSEYNIVLIDLPHIPPKTLGSAEAYASAAKFMEGWTSEGVLVREKAPALYLYHQVFNYEGQTVTRRMFIGRVRLHPFDDGVILPHEQTFGGPKEDRLALTKATQCNLSPIFGLYSDPDDLIGHAFEGTAAEKPHATGKLEGVENRLWVVIDPAVTKAVTRAMADRKIYIADGHHRYSTALNYRDWYVQEGHKLGKDHPANYVMFVLASMDDPGCVILPYHRFLAGVDLGTVRRAWAEGTEPANGGLADVVLHYGATGEQVPLRFTKREVLRELEAKQVDAWYDLDTAYLHRYLIDELLSKKLGSPPQVGYVKSADDARAEAKDQNGVALLVNPTPMAHLKAVSEQGGLMPQKSTYFYPKLATGLTINPLG